MSAAGYTGNRCRRPAHRLLRLYRRFLLTGTEVMFGSRLSVYAAHSRTPLQHWQLARKGSPNIDCSTSSRPAYHSRRGRLSVRSKQESKKYLWTSPCRTSAHLLTGTTQIDLMDVPLLSLLNLPGTKST